MVFRPVLEGHMTHLIKSFVKLRRGKPQCPWRVVRRWIPVVLAMGIASSLVWMKFYHVAGGTGESHMQWRRLADMPVGVMGAAISISGNFVVITGGVTQFALATNLIQVFDRRTSTWQMPLQRLKTSRATHAQVTLRDGRIFVVGGRRSAVPQRHNMIAGAEIFDLVRGLTTPVTPLRQRLASPTAHLLPDGRVIVIARQSAWIFEPSTSTWVQEIRLRDSRMNHSSVMLPDGLVLVAGGQGCRSFELIDPDQETSIRLAARMPNPVDDLRLVALPDGRVWVIGGQNTWNGNTTDQTWVVDLSDKEGAGITEGPSLNITTGVSDHCVARVGTWVIVAGGESQQKSVDTGLNQARLLDSRTMLAWSLPDLHHPHDDAVAVATERGMIIFGGLYDDRSFLGRRLLIVGTQVEQLDLPIDGQGRWSESGEWQVASGK